MKGTQFPLRAISNKSPYSVWLAHRWRHDGIEEGSKVDLAFKRAVAALEAEQRGTEAAARQNEILAEFGRNFLQTAAEASAELAKIHVGSAEN